MNKLSGNHKLEMKDKSTAMIGNLADRVCNNCEMRSKCWEKS